jgi:hypothetical protein
MLSILILFIPVVIGLAAVSILARKLYLACKVNEKKALPQSDPNESTNSGGLAASLNTTDSIEDINFDHVSAEQGFWIQLKKYTHVAKTETPTPGDEEAGLEELV